MTKVIRVSLIECDFSFAIILVDEHPKLLVTLLRVDSDAAVQQDAQSQCTSDRNKSTCDHHGSITIRVPIFVLNRSAKIDRVSDRVKRPHADQAN